MALDPTARETNVTDSLKKYFVDNLETAEGILLVFDKQVVDPAIHRMVEITRWVAIHIGAMQRSELSQIDVELWCATRQDSEYFRLAQLCDTVMGYLTDTTQTDTMRRIPFYRSRQGGRWTALGGSLLVWRIVEGERAEGPDDTKFKLITATIRWPSKV